MRAHARPWSVRHRGIVTGVILALLVALAPAPGAGAWPMSGHDPQHTWQADVAGPSDPGLRWFTDVAAELDGYDLSQGAGSAEDNIPVISPDGDVVLRATNTDAQVTSLIALDGQDGTLAWAIDGVLARCAPAIDAAGTLWVLLDEAAHDDLDDPALQAYDPSTGTPQLDRRIVFEGAWSASLCNRASLQVGGSGSSQVLVMFGMLGVPNITAVRVGGPVPELAWSIDADDDPPIDQVARQAVEGAVAAFSDDALLVPAFTDDRFELVAFSLVDGSVLQRVALPVLDADGNATPNLGHLRRVNVLVSADRAVVGAESTSGSYAALVHGVDLTTGQVTWTEQIVPSRTVGGPSRLARSGSTVVYNANLGVLLGNDIATGAPTSWSGTLEVRELGGFDLVTDRDGNLYTVVPGDGGAIRIVRYSAQGTTDWRVPAGALQNATGVAPGSTLRIAGITPNGALVLYGDGASVPGRITVIDDSGGLAEQDQCILPFVDVSEGSVHAVSICRLVELEVTTGTTPERYSPAASVTRAQMGTFLARALNLTPVETNRFPDVEPGSVHAANINAIAEAGITLGRADGTYDPAGTVTRAEMASFLARAAGLEGVAGSGFTDVDAASVHAANIYAVRDAEITTGVTPTTFDPDGEVRRDQMASFLIRLLDVLG